MGLSLAYRMNEWPDPGQCQAGTLEKNLDSILVSLALCTPSSWLPKNQKALFSHCQLLYLPLSVMVENEFISNMRRARGKERFSSYRM